jgi:hypothetical protein
MELNVTVFLMRTGRIVQGTVMCTDRGTATERYCVCYENGGRIVQGTVMCTERGTATERYCVCYEDWEDSTRYCNVHRERKCN